MAEVASPAAGPAESQQVAPEVTQIEQTGERQGETRPTHKEKPQRATARYNRSFSAMEIKPIPPTEAESPDKVEKAGERNELGRFVKRDTADGLPTALPEPEQELDEEFDFAGKKWKGRRDAEQNFKSLQGQFKPLQSKVADAESKAVGWWKEAQRLAAELESARKGTSQPAKQDVATSVPQSDKGIDWELYAEIRKAAEEAGKPYEAERWLIEQHEAIQANTRKTEREEFQKQLLESLKPLQQMQLEQAALDHIENTRATLAEHVDEKGEPLFPELDDPAESYAIGQVWVKAGMPPELALTPQGAATATLLYRFLKAQSPAQETEINTEGETEETDSPAHQARSAMVVGGSVARERGSDLPPEVARLLSSMRKTGQRTSYFIDD